MTECWPTLLKAIDLSKAGRKQAAKSLWTGLPEEFRVKVMQYVYGIMTSDPATKAACPTVYMTSPYGEFSLSPAFLDSLTSIVQELLK
jgi:hypothetical protein